MLDLQRATPILKLWGIGRFKILPSESVPGSPERSLSRTVVEDFRGTRYILEQLVPGAYDDKRVIADRIHRLRRRGLPVCPYLKGENGSWIQRHGGFCWQLAPLMQGVPLDREHYWNEGWRGEAVGHFLADLSTATCNWEPDGAIFSLPGYIEDLNILIERHDPEYRPGIAPIVDFLRRRFYPVADETPTAFCHGDPHPINTIWGKHRIIAVIDWEFCGWKPMLYDAALVMGCVGAEAPEARQAGFITAFLETLGKRRLYSEKQMDLLPLFVLAVRFGWMSEWLRRKDIEMIEFELYYMNLLMATAGSTA